MRRRRAGRRDDGKCVQGFCGSRLGATSPGSRCASYGFTFAKALKRLIDFVAGQRPAPPWQSSNRGPLEALVKVQRLSIIGQVVSQNGQRQLRRAAAAVAPLETVGAVEAQVEARVKSPAVDGHETLAVRSLAFIPFHWAPP